MKIEGNIFAGFGIFVIPCTWVYWHFSNDPTGTTALIMAIGLCALCGFYLLFTAKRIDARPEDDSHAEIADAAGELGFYSPYSWWPLAVAANASWIFLSTVFGWFLLLIGVPLLAFSVWGLVFEYYRGDHAH